MAQNFTAKERADGEPCFVTIEGWKVDFQLLPPANLEHAQQVARFLKMNVSQVVLPRIEYKLVDPNDVTWEELARAAVGELRRSVKSDAERRLTSAERYENLLRQIDEDPPGKPPRD